MSEINKLTAIVLETKDYKEKDKLVTLFSLESGIVNAVMKSVKGSNAKLKSAKEPFCFGEYLISEKKGFNTITSVNILDTFFDLTKDYDKYIYGCNILLSIKNLSNYGEVSKELFITTIKALKMLCYEKVSSDYVMIKFLLDAFIISGYGITYKECNSCGGNSIKKYFDYSIGAFVCNNCKTENSSEIEPAVFNALRIINDMSYEKLSNLKLANGSEKKALDLLYFNYKMRFGKSLTNLD